MYIQSVFGEILNESLIELKSIEQIMKKSSGKRKSSSFTGGVSYVCYALAAIVLMLALLIGQHLWRKRNLDILENDSTHYDRDSYKSAVFEQVNNASDKIKPEVLRALRVYQEPEAHPNKMVRNLPSSLDSWPPGEMGVGVTIDPKLMPEEDMEKKEEMWHKHAFNEYVSELISVNRSLPDWRGDWCRANYDENRPDLKPTSIIICFHNEAWSTLLRTVHSIVNRTPKHLLEEILLIDDSSNMDHLGPQLDEYMSRFDKVRIVRGKERMGLIRCRMFGSQEAKADVLTYLDSHIEAGVGWLEPLLYAVQDDPNTIACPVIDAVNDTTFYYTFIAKDLKGVPNWNMVFEWHEVPTKERLAKSNVWAPYDNPVMAGGLFSVQRDWFEQIGYYDTGMEVWGGENLEVSFKTWMCGGRIVICPCSRVGHVFRTFSPYKVENKDVRGNNVRVAEVWMDEFKYLYYDRLGKYDRPLSERLGNFGDVSERKAFRENRQCRSFEWFLRDVVKGMLPYHDLLGAGEVRNDFTGYCLDQNDRMDMEHSPVYAVPCHGDGGNQYWWLNKNGYLMRDYSCVGVNNQDNILRISHCGKIKPFRYNPKQQRLMQGNKCVTIGDYQGIFTAMLEDCKSDDDLQQWKFSKFNPMGLKYSDLGDEKLIQT